MAVKENPYTLNEEQKQIVRDNSTKVTIHKLVEMCSKIKPTSQHYVLQVIWAEKLSTKIIKPQRENKPKTPSAAWMHEAL